MVPDKFNMVDMGGIDLIMMQGEEVPGLYNRLVESIVQCRYQCLYNWLFDGVIIPPTYVEMEVNEDEEVAINEGVTVSEDDVIHIYSLSPGPVDPEIIPLLAEENGVYNVPTGKDGFNPVTVDVPSYIPVIDPITITENGTYNSPSGVDGYSPVIVDVPSSTPVINSLTVTENGTYNPPSGVDGYAPVIVNVPTASYTLIDASEISASADSSYTGLGPENAYGTGSQNYWASGDSGVHTWVAELDSAKKIILIKFSPYYLLSGSTYWYTDRFVFSGSNDGVTWDTLETVINLMQSSNQFTAIITNISQAYKYYKFECWPGAWVCIGKVQFFT